MTQWLYKATNAKLDKGGTLLLARRGFLCRSAYTAKGAWVANVRKVFFGDVLNVWFIGKQPSLLGAFEVIRREAFHARSQRPTAEDFSAEPVPGSALYEVTEPAFIHELDPGAAYKVDPRLGRFTGWLLRRVAPDAGAHPSKFLAQTPTLAMR